MAIANASEAGHKARESPETACLKAGSAGTSQEDFVTSNRD